MRGAVGLDLSLARSGMCYVPPNWEGDMASLRVDSIETKRVKPAYGKPDLLARIDTERYLRIAESIVKFVKDSGANDVAKENYAYSPVKNKKGQPVQSSSTTKLAELGGVIKSQLLLAARVSVVSVAVNTARSWVVGGMKRGKQKEQVDRFLQSRGLRFKNWDEMDAFVIAYYWYGQVNDVRSRFLPQKELDFGLGPG